MTRTVATTRRANEIVLDLPGIVRLRDERHETYSLEVVGAHDRA